MKKILKFIPIFLTAILFAVFFNPIFLSKETTSAEELVYPEQGQVESEFVAEKYYTITTPMFLEYASNVLVGVDGEGNVYRAESGLPTNLEKTGTKLNLDRLPSEYLDYCSYEDKEDSMATPLLCYGNNVLLFLGSYQDGTDKNIYIRLFRSEDFGKTWTSIDVEYGNFYPLGIYYNKDHFVVVTNNGVYETTDGKKITSVGQFPTNLNSEYKITFSGGYLIETSFDTKNINVSYNENPSSGKLSDFIEMKKIKIPETLKTTNAQTIYFNNSFLLVCADGSIYQTVNENFEWTCLGRVKWIDGSYSERRIINLVARDNCVYVACPNYIFKLNFSTNSVISTLVVRADAPLGYYDTVIFSEKNVTVGNSNSFSYKYTDGYEKTSKPYFVTVEESAKYTVEFRDWDGSLISSTFVQKNNLAVTPSDPYRVGYRFTGWDKSVSALITENTVFTAQYEINKYTVTFEVDNRVLQTLTIEYGATVPEDQIPSPTKEGYKFTGWDKNVLMKITSDTVFTAQFSQNVYLTFKFRKENGTFGLLNQFKKTTIDSFSIEYTIGDLTNNEAIQTFYSKISDWTEDGSDGVYEYDTLFTGWDIDVPEVINEDITINAMFETLNLVRCEYYSFLNFVITEDSNYYSTFIGYMKIERLIRTGEKINLDDFKRSDVDYEVYNEKSSDFYNNIVGFNFTGWDKDITEPITDDTTFIAKYEMPTFNVKYYDGENYLIDETNEQISFMTVNQLHSIISTSQEKASQFKTFLKNFLTLRWGKVIDQMAENMDTVSYLQKVNRYSDISTQLLTGYVVIDSDRPGIYDGFFTDGTVSVNSSVLEKFAGSQENHNMSYWISPIMFSTEAYPMSATVTYKNILNSAIKTTKQVISSLGSIFTAVWKFLKKALIIVLIVGAVIFFIWLFKTPIRNVINKADSKRKTQKAENKKTKEKYKETKKNKN